MKPLNIDKTGCSNMSSNCVVWQGPDIDCINLCKGDSVTEVVYKLALELCNLMDTFDLKNYDLKCFSTGVCQPQNFKDFINILINKVCALQECTNCGDSCNPCSTPPVTSSSSGNNGDTYVPIAKIFQFKGPTGDDVTMLKVSDYAQAIGNRVSEVVNSVSIVQKSLQDHEERISAMEKEPDPVLVLPTIIPQGVLPREATSIELVVAATEQQFIALQNAVGNPNTIYLNMQKMDPSINDLNSLAVPGNKISNLPGYTITPANMAELFGNVLLILGDMRAAIKNITDNYLPTDCSTISLNLTAVLSSTQLTFYFTGTLPAGTFFNTNNQATSVTISDSHGTTVTYSIDIFSTINSPTGYVIDLNGTRLILTDNLLIQANPSFTSRNNNSICASYISYTVVNVLVCPTVSYTPAADFIGFSFISDASSKVYTLEIYALGSVTPLSTQAFISNGVNTYTGRFNALTPATTYQLRVKINTTDSEKTCEFTNVTTL